MKKIFNFLMIFILSISLFACNKKQEIKVDGKKEAVEETIKQEDENYLDLTFMSGTVLYAEVLNIMTNPSNYENKTIKMKGLFTTGQDMNHEMIFGCLIPDATACCAQGIEFVLADESLSYPSDYPEIGDEIIVEGDFFYEQTDKYLIVRLDNARLIMN